MEKEYKQMQQYKRNICRFPSINFYKPKIEEAIFDNKKYNEIVNSKISNKPTKMYINDGYLNKMGKEILEAKKRKKELDKKSQRKKNEEKIDSNKDIVDSVKKNLFSDDNNKNIKDKIEEED